MRLPQSGRRRWLVSVSGGATLQAPLWWYSTRMSAIVFAGLALVIAASGAFGLVARRKAGKTPEGQPVGAVFRLVAGLAMLGFVVVQRAT